MQLRAAQHHGRHEALVLATELREGRRALAQVQLRHLQHDLPQVRAGGQ